MKSSPKASAARNMWNHSVIITPGSLASLFWRQAGIGNHAGDGSGISHPPGDIAQGQKDRGTQATRTQHASHGNRDALRHVLKTANRHGWLPYCPTSPHHTRRQPKSATGHGFPRKNTSGSTKRHGRGRRTRNPPLAEGVTSNLHDYVLFMANTGLRPDEAARLEFRDVAIVTDEATGERILEIEVRGKRGVGYCKSMTGAVMPFERLRKRNKPEPTDNLRIFWQNSA
jgi:hypothetical protein